MEALKATTAEARSKRLFIFGSRKGLALVEAFMPLLAGMLLHDVFCQLFCITASGPGMHLNSCPTNLTHLLDCFLLGIRHGLEKQEKRG